MLLWKLSDTTKAPIERAEADKYESARFNVQAIAPGLKICRCLSCNTGVKIDVSSVRQAVYLSYIPAVPSRLPLWKG